VCLCFRVGGLGEEVTFSTVNKLRSRSQFWWWSWSMSSQKNVGSNLRGDGLTTWFSRKLLDQWLCSGGGQPGFTPLVLPLKRDASATRKASAPLWLTCVKCLRVNSPTSCLEGVSMINSAPNLRQIQDKRSKQFSISSLPGGKSTVRCRTVLSCPPVSSLGKRSTRSR
jgi:hypothetical protein